MSGKKKAEAGIIQPRTGRQAQVSLELAAAFTIILLLFFGIIQVFVWINQSLVTRQQDYLNQRVASGNGSGAAQVDESDKTRYPNLNIFNK